MADPILALTMLSKSRMPVGKRNGLECETVNAQRVNMVTQVLHARSYHDALPAGTGFCGVTGV